jgi:hypothetical protein
MEVGWLTSRAGRFTPGKETMHPLCRRLGENQGRSGRVRKISSAADFDPRTVQSVASLPLVEKCVKKRSICKL